MKEAVGFLVSHQPSKSVEELGDVSEQLAFIEQQVAYVLSIMNSQTECRQVVSVLASTRASVDQLISYMVTKNLQECMLHTDKQSDAVIEEAIAMIVKSR
ncbi:metal-sensing transcriptional repressor [Bacillus salinus]|uniref:metal-sensing transcriptional repressor n=1 Tax=Bacillus sp. HMF5848 TaxID=2495421 RepID=UPI0037BE466A